MASEPGSPGFTRRGLLGAGAALAGALSVGGVPLQFASAAAPKGDAEILAGLAGVELLSIAVVQHLLANVHLEPRAARLARRILLHERVHAEQLGRELALVGHVLPPPPGSVAEIDRQLAAHHTERRLESVHNEHEALDLLLAMESIAEGALYTAMSELAGPALQTLGARLLACEAQHEAALGSLRHPKDPNQATPYAFVEGIR